LGLRSTFNYKKIVNDFSFKYGISGYRKNDITTELKVVYPIKKDLDLSLNVGYHLSEPNLNFINYSSNHFRWNNSSFKKQTATNFNASLILKKWQLILSMNNKLLSNTLFFNELVTAEQNKGQEQISTFSLTKQYRVLNFHFRTSLKYQVTSDKFLFPLPDLIGRQVTYYEKSIFKKVLKVQIGFGVSYSTEYYGFAYSPALTEFHVQRENRLGNYPNVDVFINMHLKRAQLFLKYEHIRTCISADLSFVRKVV